MLIEMKVSALTVDPFNNMPLVILKEIEGNLSLPIWIGVVEASAIATELESIHLDRPMTHDLMKTILATCGVQVDRVEITDLRDDTFYATIFLRGGPGQSEMAVDARPSDAIALALRARAPVYVAKKVLDSAQDVSHLPDDLPEAAEIAAQAEQGGLLEKLSEGAFGKWKM